MTETISPNKTPSSTSRRSKLWRAFKWLFGISLVLGLICAIIIFVLFVKWTRDLPSTESLSKYEPPVMSRVHAGDGKLIYEFSKQARVFVPVNTIPRELQLAFVSAEDQRFYTHNGWDPIGLTRAALSAPGKKLKGQRIGGTSTLTQQVAKNFLVGDDYSIKRKVREIAIARRMEQAFTKDQIIELYLNEIYFGRGAYGVAAASLKHFGKPMQDLTLAEMTYLAAVPKGPSNYRLDDERGYQRAKNRQAYILGRMVEDGYITQDEADAAKVGELDWTKRLEGAEYLASEYFVEEARKQIYQMYGEDELYEGGLSIRTTLDTSMQLEGRRALRRGLEMMDRRHGYRGPLTSFESMSDWKKQLSAVKAPLDIGDWRVALVMEVSDKSAELRFVQPADFPEDETYPDIDAKGTIALSDFVWAKKALAKGAVGPDLKSAKEVLKTGDVILVERKPVKAGADSSTEYNLRQIPKANGGLLAMDPHTGRVLAMVGGYSFDQSQFNRATQAKRQPGSAFKPFVYAAALENGFTPADQILDAPFVIERKDVECEESELGTLQLRDSQEEREEDDSADQDDECERFYKPENYNAGNFYGLSTLRLGIEKSRNAMTVRLANEMGMAPVMQLSQRFGIYDEAKPELAWALGAGETTLLRLATAYSAMINGGKAVEPRILDRVQDGNGVTVFNAFEADCADCLQDEYDGGQPPELEDLREQVIDPVTAYQVTYIMQGVVQNGTGARLRALERPLGGKTGTTNDSFDNWFMGFSPDLVVGVYVGMDTPEQMGRETGSSSAVPIVKDFLETVLESQSKVPFRIPDGVTLAPVNRTTGEPSYIGAPDFILEAFKPGTEPTVGGLTRTIRVGSGTDSLGGFFGSTPVELDDEETAIIEDDSEEDGTADKAATEDAVEPNDESDSDLSDILDRAERAVNDEVADVELPEPSDAPETTPEPEKPVEKALDDGLY
ncbi:MAG: penicillin-binding protein 1A [Litorimonas sp.]